MKDDYNSSFWAKTFAAAPEAPGPVDDGEAEEKVTLCTKPIAVEAIIGHTQYKFLPDRMRQMVLAELVYCTDPRTRVYPGCTASMDTKIGREEAFWLSLCRCAIINLSGLVHSAVVVLIPATTDMAAHVPVFRKKDMEPYIYDMELVKEFATDLGDFAGEQHKALREALGIGAKAPFVAPIEMALEQATIKAKAAKAVEMMTLPFRFPDIGKALGNQGAEDDAADEEGGGGGSGGEGEDGVDNRCIMEEGDTTDPKYMKSIRKEIQKITAEYFSRDDVFRVIVITSPPWGVLDGERSGTGGEDEPLRPEHIRAMAESFADMLGDTAVMCFHLPVLETGKWRDIIESTGKWQAYATPIVITPTSSKGLTFYNKYQMANNLFAFVCFHKADKHPLVTSDFLRDKPGMVKLMNALWNAGTTIPSAAVPKVERVTTKIGKKATYERTQQFSTAVVRPIIRIFGRALREQDEVCVVDPFMGTGSTAMASHQLGCRFIGWDRDPAMVVLANSKFNSIVQVQCASHFLPHSS